MTTYQENRMAILAARLKARTQRDGKPLHGYAENVAAIKAEMAQLSVKGEDNGD